MIYKIALITLLSLTTTISARSLEGYKCRDHTVLSDGVYRTVRICGVMDYPTATTNYYQTVADIENNVHPSSPTNGYFNRRYISSGAWPSQGESFQRTSSPAFATPWPAQFVQTESDESEKHFLNYLKNMQQLNELIYPAAAATNYPSNKDDAWDTDKLMEIQRLNEQSVNSIAQDATEIKSSVTDVVSHIKNMLNTQLLVKANKAAGSDININVNLKLDPSFQFLLQDFLQLAKADVINNKNVEADESTESVGEFSNNDGSDDKNASVAPDDTAERVSQERIESEESSNEHVDDSDAKSSSEDFDTWFRIHFGPAAKLHHFDEDTDINNSEAENSSENSEESFESWFNAVYRKYAAVESKDYGTSEESTTNAHESEEIVQNENVDSSNENNSHNEYEENGWKTIEFSHNSAKVNGEESNDDVNNNNDYEVFFVPTTMAPTQRDVSVEYLGNDDKYLYTTEYNFNYDAIPEDIKMSCIWRGLSLGSYYECLKRKVEQQNERKNLVSVEIRNNSNSVESEEIDSAASESKESAETEEATTDSSESKESSESEEATTESSESKESAESEEGATDSSESKESAETEEVTTESSESKESAESEEGATDSSESEESAETEEATTDSSESKESAESVEAITDSSESKESAETEEGADSLWDYNDYPLIYFY